MNEPTTCNLIWPRRLALMAGTMDFLTGLGLVLSPDAVLQLMQVPPMAGDALVLMRWVGAFVAAVGSAYLWALARGGRERLMHVFETTLLLRAAVGTFVLIAWGAGDLPVKWLSVAATDYVLVVLQGWILAGEAKREKH